MRKCKEIHIKIHNADGNKYMRDTLTKFHVKIIENHLRELPFSNDDKVNIIDKIIKTLKLNSIN